MSIIIVEEVFDEIKKRHSVSGNKSIPHSDEFIKYCAGILGLGPDTVQQFLKVLVKAHKIFTIEITAQDALRNIPRVEGYIVADLTSIRKLKVYYQNELVTMYENQFYQKLMVHQVVKEIFPIMKSLNNTPLGQTANKAIMLEEIERLMEKNFSEYTEDWKDRQLAIEMSRADLGQLTAPGPGKAAKDAEPVSRKKGDPTQRAVDSTKYTEFIVKNKSYPLERILKIYGFDFFLKVHLRKYQFGYVQRLVEEGQIKKRSDLMMLKTMLNTIKTNFQRDAELGHYADEIYNLERSIIHHLYFSERMT